MASTRPLPLRTFGMVRRLDGVARRCTCCRNELLVVIYVRWGVARDITNEQNSLSRVESVGYRFVCENIVREV